MYKYAHKTDISAFMHLSRSFSKFIFSSYPVEIQLLFSFYNNIASKERTSAPRLNFPASALPRLLRRPLPADKQIAAAGVFYINKYPSYPLQKPLPISEGVSPFYSMFH
jgi:hypothetical protein